MRIQRLILTFGSVAVAALAAGAVPWSAHAQSAPVVSRPVVQSTGNGNTQALNSALTRLGRNPRDVLALADAADAASAMGDFAAAIGFYRRADQLSTGNASVSARVKAGLGAALTASGDPVAAIAAFDAAQQAGASPARIASDRGLAYDLIGDNLTAQRYYAMASRGGADDAAVRLRLALSQAIGGDQAASELTLMPLMRQQDKPAWRTRAFALAIGGDTAKAVEVVETILPPPLAERIVPYLRYMPRLTRAQQAAAANLGKFPRASEIGRDDPKIAAVTPAGGFPTHGAQAGAGLVPKGEPLGSKGKSRRERAGDKVATAKREAQAKNAVTQRTAPPDLKPAIETATAAPALAAGGELPPVNAGQARAEAAQMTALQPLPAPAARIAATPASAPLPAPVSAPVNRPVQASLAASTPSGTLAPRTSASTPIGAEAPAAKAATPAAPISQSQPTRVAAATPTVPRSASPGFDLARLPQTRASEPVPAPVAANPAPVVPAAAAQPGSSAFATSSPSSTTAAQTGAAVTPASVTPAPVTSAPVPAAPSPVAAAPDKPANFAEVFADLGAPVLRATPSAGAVDLRQIEPARAEPKLPEAKGIGKADPKLDPKAAGKNADTLKADAKKADAKKAEAKKPAPPAHPSRIWVQFGIGRDKKAIAYDWKRMAREAPALLKGKGPFISDMGQTNRILAGPFDTRKAADAFLAQVKKQEIGNSAHLWISPAGQVVDPLAAD